jgi:hypothetical protein
MILTWQKSISMGAGAAPINNRRRHAHLFMGTNYMRSGGESYLAHFPKAQRWLNQCATCGRQGYKPEMPEHIGGKRFNFGADKLKRFFSLYR